MFAIERHETVRTSRIAWSALALILLVAAGLRCHNVGVASFWTDELRHVIAAQSVLAYGRPAIPEVGDYWRAYPVTAVTALSFDWFGESEAAARAPFVAANLGFLVLAFLVVRRLFSTTLALLVTAFLAISPHELQWGRECRMYALLQLLYFAGSMACFAGFEAVGRAPSGADRPGRLARCYPWSLLVGGGVLFLAAAAIQPLAVNFLIAALSYCMVTALWLGYERGRRYVLAFSVTAIGLAVAPLAAPTLFNEFVGLATERPSWYGGGDAFHFYLSEFSYYYPAFAILYPLGCICLIRRYGRAGIFVTCSFVFLMYAHATFFTGRYASRYIAYIFPFFVIGVGGAVDAMGRWALMRLRAVWRSRLRALTAPAAAAMAAAVYLLGVPWLGESAVVLRADYTTNWKAAADTLCELRMDSVVLTTWPQVLTYYAGSFPDYIIIKEKEYGKLTDRTVRLGNRDIRVRFIRNLRELERAIQASDRVSLIADQWAFNNDGFFDDQMRRYVRENLEPVRHGGDERILVYRKKVSLESTASDEVGSRG